MEEIKIKEFDKIMKNKIETEMKNNEFETKKTNLEIALKDFIRYYIDDDDNIVDGIMLITEWKIINEITEHFDIIIEHEISRSIEREKHNYDLDDDIPF